MTIQALAAARPVLNLAAIARAAGIPEQTLFAKVRRSTPLSDAEADALRRVIGQHVRPLLADAVDVA